MNSIHKIIVLISFVLYADISFAQTLTTGNRTTTITKTDLTEDVDLEQYENVAPMELPEAPDVQTPEIEPVVKEEKTEEDLNFSGIYKSPSESETILYPDYLAIYCKLDAGVVAVSEDGKELHNCVNKVVRDINSDDSTLKEGAIKELGRLQYDELKLLFNASLNEKISNSNHTQEQEDLGNANINTMTEMDDQVVANEAISSYIRSMADINEAYANRMRGQIFDAFNTVNPTVLTEMEEEKEEEEVKEEEANPNPYNVEYFDRTVIYTQENPYLSPFVWIESNMCRRNVCLTPKDVDVKSQEDLSCTPQDAECPDGDYATSNPDVIVICHSYQCLPMDKSKRDLVEGGITAIKYLEGDKCEVTRIKEGKTDTKAEICPDGDYVKDEICINCTSGQCLEVACSSGEGEEQGEFHVDYIGNNKCLYNDVEINCPNGGPYSTKDGSACYSCQDRGCDEVDCETGEKVMREGLYLGNCQCVIEGVSAACSDGIYVNNKGLTESCVNGVMSDPEKKIGFDKGKAIITIGSKSYAITPEQYLDYIRTGKLADDIDWKAAETESPTKPDNFIDKVENAAGKALTWGNQLADKLRGNKNKKKDKNSTSGDGK